MSIETRETDAEGRVSLPMAFASATIIIEHVNDDELRIRKAQEIPEDEVHFFEETPIVLSDRARDHFLELLDNPPAPNAALLRLTKERTR